MNEAPTVPRPSLGVWSRIVYRAWLDMGEDQVALVAAGIAFYWLLALFPAVATGVSVWALVGDPEEFIRVLGTYDRIIPPDIIRLVQEQVREVQSAGDQTLTVSAIFTLLTSLWAANNGAKGIVSGLNVVWDLPETRGFLSSNLLGLALVAMGFAVAVLTALLFAALPLLDNLGLLGEVVVQGLSIARWPVLALVMVLALSLLYRIAPCRRAPPRAWITPGAIVGTASFILASWGFSLYVENFGEYPETYGSLAGGVIMLLWFWVAAISLLVGAELDAEIERELHADHLATVPLRHRR